MSRAHTAAAVIASAIGLVVLMGASPPPKSADAQRVRGEGIAQTHCARCHAIGTEGVSSNPKARLTSPSIPRRA